MKRLSPAAVQGVLVVICSTLFMSCAQYKFFPSQSNSPATLTRRNTLRLGSLASFKKSMSWPVRRRKINSPFGNRNGRFHEGLDLKANRGEPILAAHGGKVAYSGRMRGYGKVIILQYGPIATLYAHNRRNLVSRSQVVKRGDVIAEAGNTGRATGPHLHFEVRVKADNGKYVATNPSFFLS